MKVTNTSVNVSCKDISELHHITIRDIIKPKSFKSETVLGCEQKFKNQTSLGIHVKTKVCLKPNNRQEIKEKFLTCPFCQHQPFCRRKGHDRPFRDVHEVARHANSQRCQTAVLDMDSDQLTSKVKPTNEFIRTLCHEKSAFRKTTPVTPEALRPNGILYQVPLDYSSLTIRFPPPFPRYFQGLDTF